MLWKTHVVTCDLMYLFDVVNPNIYFSLSYHNYNSIFGNIIIESKVNTIKIKNKNNILYIFIVIVNK